MLILGLDIGGANTKAALIQFNNKDIINAYYYIEYFPFWEKTKDQIDRLFRRILSHFVSKDSLHLDEVDYIAVTMTAELSDAFQTKKEGVLKITEALSRVFDDKKLRYITTKNKFIGPQRVKKEYEYIAAANWTSTALFLGNFISNGILIDAGSTTVDIIPIVDSIPVTIGKTDIERLLNHELIYTGGLRATIPSITHFVPYKGIRVRISFEKFALISDVHRILGNISEEEYINETADNRSKSKEDCYARLARMICMDLNTISEKELDFIAQFIYQKQLDIIEEEIEIFYENIKSRFPQFETDPLFVVTGFSREFLVKDLLKRMGFKNIKLYENITNIPDNVSSSAFAVAGALYFDLKSNNRKDGRKS
jgi:probable H4MPT-linked C1 transfer pathway protein